MGSSIGVLDCTSQRKNTGFGNCVEDWKQIRGAFIFDGPRSFTATELSLLSASLAAAAIDDDKELRMYPVHKFVAPTDNTEDLIIQTFDYGGKIPVRDGDIDWMFQFVDGGNCLNSALRTHNGPGYVLFYDKDRKLLGYNKNGELAAIPTQFIHTLPWKLATGSTTAAYMIRFVFLPEYINENRAFVKAGFDLAEIKGLQDIDIEVNDFDESTGIVNVTLKKACGGASIYDQFSLQINRPEMFQALTNEGDVVDVLTVAPVSATKTFNIALRVSHIPDTGTIILSGTAPSILTSYEVPGYEIGSVELPIEGS